MTKTVTYRGLNCFSKTPTTVGGKTEQEKEYRKSEVVPPKR